jgi:Na+-translocating ferredoxin:NAD+ oxidoreductase subunit C
MMSATIKVWDIHGGIHPAENKHQSVNTPIQKAPIPKVLVFPLSQHIGAPAEAIVNIGDKVLKGQMIAKAVGFVSVPVHASTSGEVIAIEDRPIPHSSGMSAPCIVLKSDGKDEWISHEGMPDYKNLAKPALIDIIRNAGIAGMGGAGFPSAVKLNTRPEQVIETLILNGTECEPYITADDILMRERADEIIQGTLILQHIVNPTKQTLIGVEDNKPEGIAALKKAAEGTNIQIVVFPTKYPSGGEKQLIQILTGKEVPSGKLPGDIGIVCQNIGTAVAIYHAVVHGEPLVSRITTVTGNAVKKQQNYEVLLGTPISTLLEASGYEEHKVSRLIMGGPMMGFTLLSQDIPVVKTTNCILAPTQAEMPAPPPAQACIRCGMCAEACPVTLLPQQMYWFAQSKNHDALKDHHLFDCIECGACSYVCPSSIPLVQYYRASKADIRKAEADQKKAEYSKERYEARLARLEKAEAEKEAKRKERQNKAAETSAASTASNAPAIEKSIPAEAKTETPASSTDPVQAAIERAKAKAAGNAAPVDAIADAQAKIAALETRLQKAEEKLATAKANNDSNLEAFVGSVEKLQAKLAEAKANIPAAADTKIETPIMATLATAEDPVQAAIERAKAKREGADSIDPKTKLANDIASLEKRIATTHEKIRIAEAEGADTVDVLKTSVAKLQDKLDTARQQLDQLG